LRFCHGLARQHADESIATVEPTYLHEGVAARYEALAGADAGALAAQIGPGIHGKRPSICS
jgi:hypothetical protein